LAKKDGNLLVFDSDQVLKRVERMGDLFEPVRTLKQKLPPLAALQALRDGGVQVAPAPSKPVRKTKKAGRAAPRRRKTGT
jgi:hypothetical protein